jgi:hypothetical protein
MFRFAVAAIFAFLAACTAIPQAVRGVPAAEPWFALPLGEWLAEDRVQPEAIAVCRPPACGPGLVAGVMRLNGADAKAAERILADPGPLARALRQAKKDRPGTIVAVRLLEAGAAGGFGLTLARRDGKRRPAHAAALGQRSGDGLRIVLVIGEDAVSVEETARRVALEHLGT